MKEESEKVIGCNRDKLACNNCKWSALFKPTNSSCVMFNSKPRGVYYFGEECPKFEPKSNQNEKR